MKPCLVHVSEDIMSIRMNGQPVLDEVLSCCHDLTNVHDPFAMKVMKVGRPFAKENWFNLFIVHYERRSNIMLSV